jgi:hypothetical protein
VSNEKQTTGTSRLALIFSAVLCVVLCWSVEAANSYFVVPNTLTPVYGDYSQRSVTEADWRLVAQAAQGTFRGLITTPVQINGRRSQFVIVQLSKPLQHGQNLYLFFRRDNDPLIERTLLNGLGRQGQYFVDMSTNLKWQGDITEIGLDFYGDSRSRELLVSGIRIEPQAWDNIFLKAYYELLSVQGWTSSSINQMAPEISVSTATLLTAMIILWSAVGILCFGRSASKNPAKLVVWLFVPWLLADLRWQLALSQKPDSPHVNSVKLRGELPYISQRDAEIHEFGKIIKEQLKDLKHVRLFLLHNSNWSGGHNYERLRLQYHLLPLNVYNFDRFIPPLHARAGDYVVVLGPVPGLIYDEQNKEIVWGENVTKVRQIANVSHGHLFQIVNKVPDGR